jgi:LEA14-like dessication related protein
LNTKKVILGLVAAGVGYMALQALNFVKGLKIEFSKISFGGSLLAPEIYADFKIVNPTNFSVTVNSLDGGVYYNDKLIASVNSIREFQVSANTFVISNIKIIPTIAGAMELIKQFLSKSITNDFRFIGHVYAGHIPFSINQKLSA